MEPSSKRTKYNDCFRMKMKAILPDDCDNKIPLEMVYVSIIPDKKQFSKILQELTTLLPIPKFHHLKRVRNNGIILLSVNDLEEGQLLCDFLRKVDLSADLLEQLCENVQMIKVPAAAAKLRWQYEVMQKLWPSKFFPNRYLESLYNGSNFSSEEHIFHSKLANLVMEMSHDLEGDKPFGICVDPRNHSIVAIAASHAERRPLRHCSMVLIDCVARTQKPTEYEERDEDDTDFLEDVTEYNSKSESTLAGIKKGYFDFIKSRNDYTDVQFGAERLRVQTTKITDAQSGACEGNDNLAKYGPYLCTGYEVYLSQEPCLMCAMALVHSRVKRIFFVRLSKNGAVGSCFKLQSVKELNHHYEVFQCSQSTCSQNF